MGFTGCNSIRASIFQLPNGSLLKGRTRQIGPFNFHFNRIQPLAEWKILNLPSGVLPTGEISIFPMFSPLPIGRILRFGLGLLKKTWEGCSREVHFSHLLQECVRSYGVSSKLNSTPAKLLFLFSFFHLRQKYNHSNL